MHSYFRWVCVAVFLSILAGIFFVVRQSLDQRCPQVYELLNPLVRCSDQISAKREYETFRDQLVLRLQEEKSLKKVEIALYFRDLQAGPWFGINEDTEFFPASLTKVPTMISLLKIVEKHPEILKQLIGLDDPPPVVLSVPSGDIDRTLLIGESYSAEEVLRRSIVYSDNVSDFLLRVFIGKISGSPNFLLQTFQDLGMSHVDEKELTLSVKNYASIFRLLYNSQYLRKDLSQKALELLSASEYSKGLRALLPPDVRVAHKFGYFQVGKGTSALLQLHDCGIIYHPVTPYTLCIMTRGQDLPIMTAAIAELSKMVYDEVTIRSENP